MPEIETEQQLARTEVADFLREAAGKLEREGPVTLELGGQSITMDPVGPVTFKLEGEVDPESAGTVKESIEFELVWRREAAGETGTPETTPETTEAPEGSPGAQ